MNGRLTWPERPEQSDPARFHLVLCAILSVGSCRFSLTTQLLVHVISPTPECHICRSHIVVAVMPSGQAEAKPRTGQGTLREARRSGVRMSHVPSVSRSCSHHLLPNEVSLSSFHSTLHRARSSVCSGDIRGHQRW